MGGELWRGFRKPVVASWSHTRGSVRESVGRYRNGFRDGGGVRAVRSTAGERGHCGTGALHCALQSAQKRASSVSRPRSVRGFRLTPRDREMVRWIGRLRMATAAQVAKRFELGRAVSYARLNGLVRLGLLEHARIFHAAPGVYLATRAGLALVDLALPPSRVDLRTYDHDLELSTLVAELEREFGVERIVTEREMRAADTPIGRAPVERPRFAVGLAGAHGQLQLTPVGHPRLHFPDCTVSVLGPESDARMLAVELERTAKGRARLRRILSGYVAARHIAAVRYYAQSARVRDLIESEVASLKARAFVEIRHRCADVLTDRAA